MSGTSGAKEPRRRLSGSERRRAILDAGMRMFAERGYERASMREIARSAGITTPVIYDHFSSKRELQTALLGEQEAALRIHQGRERELEPGADLARALIDDFFSWVESHPYAWRMQDRKSTRLNSSHTVISYAVFCLKKKKQKQ